MRKKKRSSSGQAVMEYAFVIAFVCLLIALAFNLASGSLFSGISGAYSNINWALSTMNATATNHNASSM